MLWAEEDRHASECGASAVEYGLLAAAIAAIIAIVVFALGLAVQGQYVNSCAEIEGQVNSGTSCVP